MIDYYELEPGYEFPSSNFTLTSLAVDAYVEATSDSAAFYRESGLVPPMAAAALAMAAQSENLSFPDGAIHVSQQVQFCGQVSVGEAIVCTSKILSQRKRGKFHMLAIGMEAVCADNRIVFKGSTSFILPAGQEAG
ncbi:MAG: hypothetical protein HN929_12425 [Chloroflexi bacterium]|nr:hypothetical protein [Chloroflexota bacterium]MBT7082246.1 hypothetical protein [Chloroflexota bacterium]MBT7289537.1 hypothetical protein [Chloroflexota bacterium]